VPLGTVHEFSNRVAPLAVNHQGQFPAVTVSFNLAPGIMSHNTGAAHDPSVAAGRRHRPARTGRKKCSGVRPPLQTSVLRHPLGKNFLRGTVD